MKVTFPDAVTKAQSESNRHALRCEALYETHREALTAALLGAAGPPGGRLALLGAGNCLDVDLPRLAARFDEIHLVDLDAAALARAVARQPPSIRPRIVPHAPVDLSGFLPVLPRYRTEPPTLAALDAAVAPAVERLHETLGGGFALAASTCLATQLSRGLTAVLGEGNPLLADLRRRVMTVHLRTLAALAPGGRALYASDLTSNDTYPLDDLPQGADLAPIVAELVRTGNFFFGTDPTVVSQVLRRDPVLAQVAGPAQPLAPWLWRISETRTFVVYGFTFAVGTVK